MATITSRARIGTSQVTGKLYAWLLPLIFGFLLGGLVVGVAATIGTYLLIGGSAPPVPATATVDANPDLSVFLSDGLMTNLVRQSVSRGQAPIALENAKVTSRDAGILISGDVPALLVRVSSSIDLAPDVAGGKLRMRVISASLGPVRVPADLSGLLEVPINQRLDALTSGFDATITGAKAGAGGLTVNARLNSPAPAR